MTLGEAKSEGLIYTQKLFLYSRFCEQIQLSWKENLKTNQMEANFRRSEENIFSWAALAVCLPVSPEDRMLLETVTLSSEFLAQSTMPLQPFMGKVMSVAALAGSL